MSKQRKKCHFFVVVSNQISDKWPMFFVSWIPNQKCIIEWNWFVSVCLLQSMEWEIKQNNFYLDFFFCAFVSVATESRDSGHFYWVSRKSIFKCLFFFSSCYYTILHSNQNKWLCQYIEKKKHASIYFIFGGWSLILNEQERDRDRERKKKTARMVFNVWPQALF